MDACFRDVIILSDGHQINNDSPADMTTDPDTTWIFGRGLPRSGSHFLVWNPFMLKNNTNRINIDMIDMI